MLKRILIPLDTSEYTTAAIRMAAHIALRSSENGRPAVNLAGMGIIDLDQIPSGRFASMVNREKLIADATSETAKLVEDFNKKVLESGVNKAQVESLMVQGSPFRGIIRESVFSDIIVMGEKCSFPPVNQDYDTMHHLYHESSRPIVLTDANFNEVETVLLVMDGTAPASRMLYTYMQLNPFPKARVVLAWSEREAKEYGLDEFFARARSSLEDHGFDVSMLSYSGEFEKDIPALVKKEKAGMVAIGVHRDQMLNRLTDPFHIRGNMAMRLLNEISGSLFLVN